MQDTDRPSGRSAGTLAATTRRRFLGRTLSALGVVGGADLGLAHAARLIGEPQAPPLDPALARWPWPLDIDGDGRISARDRELLVAARGTRRGTTLEPPASWDLRADLDGRGRVGREHVELFDALVPLIPARVPARPLVACWHYGWYRGGRRGRGATVRYRGGRYTSRSRHTEEQFNRTKHEFGIGAELLSWIDDNEQAADWEAGYLAAANRPTRRFGILYESVINLGSDTRLSFGPESAAAAKFIADFRRLGAWLRRVSDPEDPSLLRLDGRPVVYVFASHLFGADDGELGGVESALDRARDAFAGAFGAPPYLIGDESPFASDVGVTRDRLRRARCFDAVTRYHHYDEGQIRAVGAGARVRLDEAQRARIVANERRALDAFGGLTSRVSGAPLLVVPSSAAGFAKHGVPKLVASRDDYRAHLLEMQALTDEHLAVHHRARLGTSALPMPLVIAGSWNEEYEGHALMPASSNDALLPSGDGGFDWLAALRSVYGWNHAARTEPSD